MTLCVFCVWGSACVGPLFLCIPFPMTQMPYHRRIRPAGPSYRDRMVLKALKGVLPTEREEPCRLSTRHVAQLTGIGQGHCTMHMKRLEHLRLIECYERQRQGCKVGGLWRLTRRGAEFDCEV